MRSYDSYFVVRSLAIQSDGKIVMGGHWQNSNGYTDFALARFNINGSLDNSFGKDGIQITDLRTYSDDIESIAIQSDQKIVAAGNASNGRNNAFAIARYNTNGSLDNTFDLDGKKMTYITSNDIFAEAVAIQSNGKLVAAGYEQTSFSRNAVLIRYNTNGSLDNTLAGDGTLIDHFGKKNTVFTSSAVQKDGKIVAAGYTWNGKNYDFAVVRYNTNGSLDNSFSSDGIQITDLSSSDNRVTSIGIQMDGKIVATGSVSNGSNSDFGIVRYNTDGSLDNTFSEDGKVTIDFGFNENVNSLAIQSDGKIVIAGNSNGNFALARFNTDGTPDKSFSGDGKQTTIFTNQYGDISSGSSASSLTIQSDGKIVVAGNADFDDPAFAIARYNSNGSLDNTFAENGMQTTEIYSFFNYNSDDGTFVFDISVKIQTDGRIIIGGSGGFYYRDYKGSFLLISRYNSDGSFDNTFSEDGRQVVYFTTYSNDASIALQDNGKILVQGNLTDYVEYGYRNYDEVQLGFAIARLNTDGNPDPTFGTNGVVYSPQDQVALIQDIAIADNKLYAAGYGQDISNFGFLTRYLLTENKVPVVSITSPANNTVYTAPATITINASAADTDGIVSSVKFYNGTTYLKTDFTSPYTYTLSNLPAGNYTFTAKATDNSGAQTISAAVTVSVKATNKAPAVSITSPANNAAYTAPATITVNALAADEDGTISSVKFYNGTTYLKTDFESPYTYTLSNLPAGAYSLTVKATDNNGAQTISAPVKVTINKAPVVSITSPTNNATYTAPANITIKASASDADGIISSVKFYNGATYLKTVFTSPYAYTLSNLPAGNYSLTAKATDNKGAQTISAAVTVSVKASNAIVSNKPTSVTNRTDIRDAINLSLAPNPARDIVNIYLKGLQQNKQATLTVISVSGVVMKTMRLNNSNQTIQLDVSSLVKGVYTIKVICGDKVMYKQLVKL